MKSYKKLRDSKKTIISIENQRKGNKLKEHRWKSMKIKETNKKIKENHKKRMQIKEKLRKAKTIA